MILQPRRAAISNNGRKKFSREQPCSPEQRELTGLQSPIHVQAIQIRAAGQCATSPVVSWLPTAFTPGIMHGDYHLKNVMFTPDGPAVAAVIDWELATIGDPLLDLGWLLATWRDQGAPASEAQIVVEPWDGFPTPQELIDRYAQVSGRDVSHAGWYAVLACYKLAILLEGSYARACAGKAPSEIGARMHASAIRLLNKAARIAEE